MILVTASGGLWRPLHGGLSQYHPGDPSHGPKIDLYVAAPEPFLCINCMYAHAVALLQWQDTKLQWQDSGKHHKQDPSLGSDIGNTGSSLTPLTN
jgi:hypothetical protein